MQLIELRLKNIRSYTEVSLQFPKGIVLLSGDIGAGKSTILLAIEFALFGLLRGEMTGGALLRHGAQQGITELTFKINENTFTIKRTLTRTKKGVEQDAGQLTTNGTTQDATATELKSKIITLLGYPEELLTKSKNFVYRYTVYTPQEEMKKILQEDKENRLAVLRTVFGIDKYKKITQNAASYTKTLRERQRAFDLVISDITEKKTQQEQFTQQKQTIQQQINLLETELKTSREQLEQTKKETEKYEQKRQEAETINRELYSAKTQLNLHSQNKIRNETELMQLTKQLTEEPAQTIENIQEINQKILQAQQSIQQHELITRQATIKLAEINTIKKQTTDTAHKISLLDECPTCKQPVTTAHKHGILAKNSIELQQLEQEQTQHTQKTKQAEEQLLELKKQLEELRKKERENAIAILKQKQLEQLETRKKTLEEQHIQTTHNLTELQQKISQLEEQFSNYNDVQAQYSQIKLKLDETARKERDLSIRQTALKQQETHLSATIELLKKEIEKKEQTKKQLEKIQHAHHWLTDYFIPLMDTVEKHVMAKIHHEFDTLFRQWFSMLVEDTMTARLDETFTPTIQQNGYDTDVEFLSGGEKTACALAYRLALNKTINSLINTMNTKDLLILDEPTDGFSTEQLDKMRDVLEQLQLNQVIIVSHEQKIESFADSVIRIQKQEHESEIHL